MYYTEDAIMDTFWSLLEEMTYNQISVRKIVDRCKISRSSFYYHYQDIPSLLNSSLEKSVYEIIRKYGHFGTPMDCIEPIVQLISDRQVAFLHIYHSVERESFLENLDRLCLHIVTEYVKSVLKKESIDPEVRLTLTRFYKSVLVGVTLDWLQSDLQYDMSHHCAWICKCFSEMAQQAFFEPR